MRWVACFLGFLTLAAGCVLEDKPLIPADGGVEAGPCGLCPLDAPLCTDELQCVQCTSDDNKYCTDRSLVCDTESSMCVDCLGDSDCTTADAARCVAKQCEPCNAHTQCADIDGLPENDNACDAGVCVDCTPETEAETCLNQKSCNALTRECTNTTVGSLDTCQACVADSECGEEGVPSDQHRCVEMFCPVDVEMFCLVGERFPDDETGFCLKVYAQGECAQPYAIETSIRPSLSGQAPDSYCGINETLATCTAVRSLLTNETCPGGADSECPVSGWCRNVGGLPTRCTYQCVTDVECLEENPQGRPGSKCGSSGSGGERYCGG